MDIKNVSDDKKINTYVQKSTKNASLYMNFLLKGNEGERLIYH